MKWTESATVVVKRSRFKAYCTKITSSSQLPQVLSQLLAHDKNVKKASHKHMYAYRCGSIEKGEVLVTDMGQRDCGEHGAGDRIWAVLQNTKAVNVIVIVSRWYGGTPIGSARFRCISHVTGDALKQFIS